MGKKLEELKKKDNMDKVTVIALIAYFASAVYILSSFSSIDLSSMELFKALCLFAGLAFIIPIKFYRKWLTISVYEYLIINILAVSPILCAVVILGNNSVTGDTYVETYEIVGNDNDNHSAIYILANDQYLEKEYLREVGKRDLVEVHGSDSLSIYFAEGLFGIRKIIKRRLH